LQGIPAYFAEYKDWSGGQKIALLEGNVLILAGAGRVPLYLQKKVSVTAIDNPQNSSMQKGVKTLALLILIE
jgi:hypothetical protein